MNKFNNILDFDSFRILEWETVSKKGEDVKIDDKTIENDYDKKLLSRAVNRIQDKNIDWFCGGSKSLEQEYDKDDSCIKELLNLNQTRPKLKDLMAGESGYVDISKLDIDMSVVKKVFGLHPDDIGKGEVLLPCLFSDVRMKNREEKEKGDCALVDEKSNIIYHIEVKSAGAGFKYEQIGKTNEENYAYSIAKHISSRYQKDKEDKKQTIFIFFDNELKGRIGDDNVKGFFWINVGVLTSTEKMTRRNEIVQILSPHIITGNKNTKSNKESFCITCEKDKIIIHPNGGN